MIRHLDWDGCFNTRDLGGLRTADGLTIRRGALVRSDAPDCLTPAGWASLMEHGVRIVVDLRNDNERSACVFPPGLTVVHVAMDGMEDTEFWSYWAKGGRHSTPLYYRPWLDRFPQRAARIMHAIAHAEPGGLLVHCIIGRDRTGLIVMLLLRLLGVSPEDIVDDYELSKDRLPPLLARRGESHHAPIAERVLTEHGTTARQVILDLLTTLDVERYLREASLNTETLQALRTRFVSSD